MSNTTTYKIAWDGISVTKRSVIAVISELARLSGIKHGAGPDSTVTVTAKRGGEVMTELDIAVGPGDSDMHVDRDGKAVGFFNWHTMPEYIRAVL